MLIARAIGRLCGPGCTVPAVGSSHRTREMHRETAARSSRVRCVLVWVTRTPRRVVILAKEEQQSVDKRSSSRPTRGAAVGRQENHTKYTQTKGENRLQRGLEWQHRRRQAGPATFDRQTVLLRTRPQASTVAAGGTPAVAVVVAVAVAVAVGTAADRAGPWVP